MGIAVPHGVKPVPGLVFSVARACQQKVNIPLVRIGSIVRDKRFKLFEFRRKSGQYECRAARQHSPAGFGSTGNSRLLETIKDEPIDRLLARRLGV